MSPLISWVTRACCKRATTGQGRARKSPGQTDADGVDEARLDLRQHDIAASNDNRADDDKDGEHAEQQRQSRRARLRAGDLERLRQQSVAPSAAAVGGGDNGQQWH